MLAPRLVAGLLLVAVLSGCGGEEVAQPPALPAPPSPSASPSPSPAASPTPADDRAAVEAAVRFYYDGFNRAAATGDAQELAKGTTPDCPCRSAVDLTADVLRKGRIVDSKVTVKAIRIIEAEATRASVQVLYTSVGGRVVSSDGREVQTLQGEPNGNVGVEVVKRDGTWLVATIRGLGG